MSRQQRDGREVDTLTGEVMDDDRGSLVAVSAGALAQMTGAEVDVQVATAHRYPRNVSASLNEAKSLATITPEIAEACFYSLPRGGKTIQGKSVRLAEIMASAWGNLHVAARIVDEGQTHITAQAFCWDLQKNVRVGIEVKRRITNRNGERFNEDMITVASQAALAIARRNAIFAVIPDGYSDSVYDAALATASGSAVPLSQQREKAVSWFVKRGVSIERLCAKLDVPGVDDMTLEHVTTLRGLATALNDGTTTLESEFPAEAPAPAPAPAPAAPAETASTDNGTAPTTLVDVPPTEPELTGRRRGAR